MRAPDSRFIKSLHTAIYERRQQIVQAICNGMPQEEYIRSIGILNGIDDVEALIDIELKKASEE